MNFNWKIIRQKLYGILKSLGKDVKTISMYDEKGNETIDPLEANRFFVEVKSQDSELDTYKILAAVRDKGQSSHIDIKCPNLFNDDDFNTVEKLVNHIRSAIGTKEGIKVNWQQFDKEIDTREEAMHNIKESKDVGKLSGTTKSSFQRIGNARLIIRHTDTVNEDKHGARTRHIKALFVENKLGERFAYPHPHMAGARAFARHISNGGSNHDDIAQNIYSLSEDYLSLRKVAKVVRMTESAQHYASPIRNSMDSINKRLKTMHGPKGYANITKEFINENSIVDSSEIEKLHVKLAETCQCQHDSPMWNDFGVAAKYMAQQPMTTPVTFTWSRQPNMSSHVSDNISQRMHDQIMELASACTNEDAANKLREVASMIIDGQEPQPHHMDMVKEAFASSLKYVPEKTMIPEETEFDSFIAEFDLNSIFSEDSEQDSVKALVAAGEDPNEAEKEVMDVKTEAIDDEESLNNDGVAADDEEYLSVDEPTGDGSSDEETSDETEVSVDDLDEPPSMGYVRQYGEIIARAGDKILCVDEDEEYDADGELENVKRNYTVLTDLGNDKYKREEALQVTPYDKSNRAALDAFRKRYDSEDNIDEGFWDNVKQAGREFWHGTDQEKREQEYTKQAFDRYRQNPAAFKDKPVNELPDDDDIKEADAPVPMAARQLYAQTYAKNCKTARDANDAEHTAYQEVAKKFGKKTADDLAAYHYKNQNTDDVQESINRLTKLAGI